MASTRHAIRTLTRSFSVSRRVYGNQPLPAIVTTPTFISKVDTKSSEPLIPSFRILDGEGAVLPDVTGEWKQQVDELTKEEALKIYETMIFLPALDSILYNSQRQGRISFYMTHYGEEAAVVGSAAAWKPTDEVFAQYREAGVLLYRGYPLKLVMAQCFSNLNDTATKGRQMPVHYGSKDYHFQTISSPLGTQIPQAAGASYAIKRSQDRKGDCVICYLGEGAASEGDFHAGLNIASTVGGPIVFFVRNNGFAISTPSSQQFAGDGIASRAPGYGIEAVRVDGNDPLSVLIASREARKRAVESNRPVIVEAMTYRVGHHSTSDDSFAYRSRAEVDSIKRMDNPIFRMRHFLERKGWWNDELEAQTKKRHKSEILKEFSAGEKAKKPPLGELFNDVYDKLEQPIREQRDELTRLIKKWGSKDPNWKAELEKFDGAGNDLLENGNGNNK